MKLSPAERGMLLSKMADDTIASIFGRRVSWVRKVRTRLAEEQKVDLESWNRIGGEPLPARRGRPPKAPKIVHVDVAACRAPEPHQIDLEEAIAAATPYRFGAPAQLEGSALADWLYDNTDCTFVQIAELTGLEPEEVQAIANGDPLPEPPPMRAMRQKIIRRPPPPRAAAPVVRLAKPAALPAEIPERVVRWARWFMDARWRLIDVAELFDVEAADLRAALDRVERLEVA
jgi:hypothetical protein